MAMLMKRCCAIGYTAVVLATGARPAAAQAADNQARFEVASVKLHVDSGSTRAGIEENESFVRVSNLSLRTVIGIAYGVMGSRLAGPGWLDRRMFDITAKPPAGYQRQQLPILLRNLLADRFKLVAHSEQREVQGYALRISPGADRLRPSEGPRTFLTGRPGLIAGNSRSFGELVPLLSQMVGTPVVDETRLTGTYDIKLEWTPSLAASAAGAAAEPEVSIFTALREQLGLRLEPIKTMAEVVVVDTIEDTPTAD
jgi:uncharacterized protein (TIGR03435 family)